MKKLLHIAPRFKTIFKIIIFVYLYESWYFVLTLLCKARWVYIYKNRAVVPPAYITQTMNKAHKGLESSLMFKGIFVHKEPPKVLRKRKQFMFLWTKAFPKRMQCNTEEYDIHSYWDSYISSLRFFKKFVWLKMKKENPQSLRYTSSHCHVMQCKTFRVLFCKHDYQTSGIKLLFSGQLDSCLCRMK